MNTYSVLVDTNVKGLRRSMFIRNPLRFGYHSPRRFRTAAIAPSVAAFIRHRRRFETGRHYVGCERRAWAVLRGGYAICARPGLTRPIALVRNRRARVGRGR